MTLECVYTIIILLFLWYNYVVGPMARTGAHGLAGRAWASNMTIVLRAGPGLDILFVGRAGPGPHNSVCGPGPGRVCTTAAGPGRAWASNHICGPGLGLYFRPVQGPNANAFVSPVTRSGQIKQVWADARINKRHLF